MTKSSAESIVRAFYNIKTPDENDEFAFTEAMSFLINETKDPEYMLDLGGFYYSRKNYDLALKYYNMSAELGNSDAIECLGYIWYYGRTGTVDYEKAFGYFSHGMEKGMPVSTYKVADMYKNGYFVERNYEKYVDIIEKLYDRMKGSRGLYEPIPDICTRLAKIRIGQGRTDEALQLYLYAKLFLAQRLKYNDFFGDISVMMWLIDDMYKIREFDRISFDFYDMFYLMTSPCRIFFRYNGKEYMVECVRDDDGSVSIGFDGKWYRQRDDFYKKARIEGNRLTAIYDGMYLFRVE